jgi:hypothetical protein
MDTVKQTNEVLPAKALFVKMVLGAWKAQNDQVNKLLDKLTDETLLKDVATGRNSGIYLLGHLIAVNDNLLPLFGLGERLYPQLTEPFLKKPDKSGLEFPTLATLRSYWKEVNATLERHFEKFTAEEWFTRHNSVSAEDFEKEPHRHKLNVLMSRTTHQGYHLGQLVFLSKGKED